MPHPRRGRIVEEENWLHFRFADVHSFPEPAYGADAKTTSMPIVHYRSVSLIDGSVPLESGFLHIFFTQKEEMFYNFSNINFPNKIFQIRFWKYVLTQNYYERTSFIRSHYVQRGGKEGNARVVWRRISGEFIRCRSQRNFPRDKSIFSKDRPIKEESNLPCASLSQIPARKRWGRFQKISPKDDREWCIDLRSCHALAPIEDASPPLSSKDDSHLSPLPPPPSLLTDYSKSIIPWGASIDSVDSRELQSRDLRFQRTFLERFFATNLSTKTLIFLSFFLFLKFFENQV